MMAQLVWEGNSRVGIKILRLVLVFKVAPHGVVLADVDQNRGRILIKPFTVRQLVRDICHPCLYQVQYAEPDYFSQ
jgi:hypothetical protein